MATLVLGAVGATIGGAMFGTLGASIGWSLGAGVGNWISQKGTDGPKLTDLRLQNASYGAPIPVGYGTKRLAGNVIDQSDLTPHEHKSGGKGGPKAAETTTYSASVCVQISSTSFLDGSGTLVNRPIKRVIAVIADGRLIFGPGSSGEAIPMTVYYGTEDQMPDPTFEALRGAGNVPAYRGKAYAVFADWDLSPYGNRIPALTFVVQFDGAVTLEYYAQWPVDYDYPLDGSAYAYPYSFNGVDSSVAGQITMHRWRSGNDYGGATPDYIVYYENKTFDYQGTELGASTPVSLDLSGGDVNVNVELRGSINSGHAYATWSFQANCPDKSPPPTELTTFAWLKDGAVTYTPDILVLCDAAAPSTVGITTTWIADLSLGQIHGLLYWNGNLYCNGTSGIGSAWLRRWPAPDGSCYTPEYDVHFNLAVYTGDTGFGANSSDLFLGNDGYLYCRVSYSGGMSPDPDVVGGWGIKLLKFDADLNLIQAWYDDPGPGAISAALGSPGFSSAVVWNGYYISYQSAGVVQIGDPNYVLYQITNDGFTFVDELTAADICNGDSPPVCNAVSALVLLQGTNLAAFRGGLITLGGDFTTLGAIVGDISKRMGYASSEYDVSQLTDMVRGYIVADRMTGRSAIDALRPTYNFGAVESNQTVKFRKWKGDVDHAIDVADLGAHPFGEDPVPLEEPKRALESDLPQSIDFVFCNPDMDYQDGHVLRQRMVTESDLHVVVAAPIVLTPEEAVRACEILLLNAWVERSKTRFQVSYKYAYVEPTDVVTVRGIARRIVNKEEQGYTHLIFDGVAAVTSVFVTQPTAAPPLGFVPQPVPVPNNTDTLLIDAALVSDSDSETGFNAAMVGRKSGEWPSAVLFKSLDGGVEYDELSSTAAPASMGVALTALGNWSGGSVIDESNTVRVRLGPGSPALASTSNTGIFNGANLCALGSNSRGWEFFNFRDAVLVDTNVYELSGLLRGRRGTEQLMGGHIPDEKFVLLPVLNVEADASELGQSLLYKGITSGRNLSSESAITFTNTGVALKPYAPVLLGGGRDGAGDCTFTWVRRTRKGGAFLNNTGVVPLSEEFEKYNLIVYSDSTYSTPMFQIIVDDATEFEYTAAQQSLDFGSPQSILYFEVGQIGAYGEGYYAQGYA